MDEINDKYWEALNKISDLTSALATKENIIEELTAQREIDNTVMNDQERRIAALQKENEELRAELKAEKDDFNRLAAHHNEKCTCLDIY